MLSTAERPVRSSVFVISRHDRRRSGWRARPAGSGRASSRGLRRATVVSSVLGGGSRAGSRRLGDRRARQPGSTTIVVVGGSTIGRAADAWSPAASASAAKTAACSSRRRPAPGRARARPARRRRWRRRARRRPTASAGAPRRGPASSRLDALPGLADREDALVRGVEAPRPAPRRPPGRRSAPLGERDLELPHLVGVARLDDVVASTAPRRDRACGRRTRRSGASSSASAGVDAASKSKSSVGHAAADA